MDAALAPIPADVVAQALGTAHVAPPPAPPQEAAPPPPAPLPEGTGTVVDTVA